MNINLLEKFNKNFYEKLTLIIFPITYNTIKDY